MNRISIPYRWLAFLIIPSLVLSALALPSTTLAINSSAQPTASSINEPAQPVRLLQANEAGVVLELKAAAPQFTSTILDDQPCQAVTIPGLALDESPGLPVLPVQGAMLGIPQEGQPLLQVISTESTLLAGRYNLCPAAQPVLAHSPNQPPRLNGYTYPRDAAYQANQFLPAASAELAATGQIRSQRYAQVRFNPLQYNPVTGEIRYFNRIRVEVNFVGRTDSSPNGQANSLSYNEGYFEDSLRSLLLNYDQARPWRSRPGQVAQTAPAAPQAQDWYKIAVNQDGIYQVSYAGLQAAGVPVGSINPHTFQLFNQGSEVAMIVQGEADGVFDATDYLLFYGQKVNTKFTDTNVYWLSWGSANGLRMSTVNGAPSGTATVPADFLTTQTVEKDLEYYADQSSGSQDHWYWGMVYADGGPAYLDFTTNIQHLGDSSHTITVRGLLKGSATDYNHHTRIYLNGTLIDDHTFAYQTEYLFNVSLSQSLLLEGTNTLRVECPLDGSATYDAVLMNWFEIEYYDQYFAENNQLFFDGDQAGTWEYRVDGFTTADIEAYDISDALHPVQITGGLVQTTANGNRIDFETTQPDEHHYLALTNSRRLSPLSIVKDSPSNWKSTGIGADYLLITPATFLTQAQTLASFRSSQGLRVQVVDLQDIYDEFNGGVFSTEAIKSFIAYAYANWSAPAPSFVLLMGDGNFDYKNNLGWNDTNPMPPYLAEVDPWIGQTATDNRYVSVSGSDSLPDLYIGRLPARDTTEAQTLVDKTIYYESNPAQGGWNARQLFVAGQADSAGDFPAVSDAIINTYVPGSYTVDKVYYKVNYNDAATAQAAVKNAINAGRLIVHYQGHADVQQWSDPYLLRLADLSSLANGNKQPLMLPFTCLEGYFIWPKPPSSDYSSLGESIVRLNGKGAIASFSPTGYGLTAGHDLLDRSLFNDLFNNDQNQLGYLTTNAKYSLYANSAGYRDLIETYLLFGDPALRLQTLAIPPSNLQASVVSSTQINLSWQDNSTDETEFRIERSPDGSTAWTQIATVGANVTSYSNTSLSCNTTYYYRVRAYRAGDATFSDYSNTASAVTYACQAYTFSAGWNLIALPFTPVAPLNSEAILLSLNAQGGDCVEIDQWLNGGWNSHILGLPFGDFQLVNGQGYFVRCNRPGSWVFEGLPLSASVTLSLNAGWNLVGVPYPAQGYTAQGLLDAIKTQGGACPEIDRWYNGGWESHVDGLPFNNFTLLPSEGYFVRCSQPSSFTP